MPKDDYWRINNLPIGPHPGPEEKRIYGESITLDVWLSPDSDSPTGAWPGYVERFKTLRRYQNYAGAFALHDLASGRVAFTEIHSAPAGAIPNDTLLVALRPPADTRIGLGGWFLVAGYTDSTTLPSALCQSAFELTFVAPLSRYPGLAAARADLEAPI